MPWQASRWQLTPDLNTGAITDKEAAERRKKLQLENSFFGSMDGATKHVKR